MIDTVLLLLILATNLLMLWGMHREGMFIGISPFGGGTPKPPSGPS